MGAQPSEAISVIPDGEQPGPFATRRHPKYRNGLFKNPDDVPTMKEFMLKTFSQYPDRPYLAERPLLPDGKYGPKFIPKTYRECESIARGLGSGLHKLGIGVGSMLGVYAPNCFAWLHTIDASCLFGYCIASLYDSLGPSALGYLIKHSQMKGIVVAQKNVDRLISVLSEDKGCVEFLLLIQNDSVDSVKQRCDPLGISVHAFDEVIEWGKTSPIELPTFDPESPHFISYSSGTTGDPKGVIISHRACVNNTIAAKECIGTNCETRHISYLPLAHVFERAAIAIVGAGGGLIGFNSGNVANLVEDMRIMKPTILAAVPRVMNRFYDTVLAKVNSANVVARGIFWGCWYGKKFCLEHRLPTFLFDTLAFNKINTMMGGCLTEFVVGAAALDRKVHEFLQVATGVPVRTGYGLTEAGSGNVCNPWDINGIKFGTVGGPLINAEVRLEPIDGYDDPVCGEILIGGQCLCSGYLHDPESSNALFYDKERTMIRTGDVGKWDEDGYLRIVDRRRSIFKLSQGEYVAADNITQVYEAAPLVKQIFVYGDSSRTCLVGIVVPEPREVAKLLGKGHLSPEELAEACRSETTRTATLAQMNELAKESKLFGYQQVRAIHLDPVEWTPDNNLLTPTFKMKRKALQDKYSAEIESLYESLQ